MARFTIMNYHGMYLEHPHGIWTKDPARALTGTRSAIADIATDSFDDGRGDGLEIRIVEVKEVR